MDDWEILRIENVVKCDSEASDFIEEIYIQDAGDGKLTFNAWSGTNGAMIDISRDDVRQMRDALSEWLARNGG